jgi:hypothetical protein
VSAGDAVPGIEVALEKPASRFEFNETPLRDVIAKIREAHSIPVELDQKVLADAGFDLDTPITQCLSGISLRSALRLLLDNIGLTYLVKNEVLLITTREADVEHPTVRLYPLPWGIAAQPRPDVQTLIDLLTSTLRSETWDCAGGYGSVRPVGECGALYKRVPMQAKQPATAPTPTRLGDTKVCCVAPDSPTIPSTGRGPATATHA